MKKLSIFLDMDGVLADTHSELLKRYNSEYGLDLKKDDLTAWDLSQIQKEGTSLTKYFNMPGFFASLPVYEGAQKGVKALSSIKCIELFVATVSTKVGYSEKERWLQRHFPEIPKNNIVFTARKDMLAGDIIIDDALHNVCPTNCKHAILFDQPWNRTKAECNVFSNVKCCNKIFRAYSWNDVVAYVYCILASKEGVA